MHIYCVLVKYICMHFHRDVQLYINSKHKYDNGWWTWESLHASLYVCEGELYLAVLYQYLWAGVALGIYVLVGIVLIKGLCFCQLHFIKFSLLRIKWVQLIFWKVINNSSTIGITNNVHWSSEPIPVFWVKQTNTCSTKPQSKLSVEMTMIYRSVS